MTGEAYRDPRTRGRQHGKDFHVTGHSQGPSDIEAASKTDTGRVRSRNEDSHLVLELSRSPLSAAGLLGLAAVADGLGGHAAGGTASRMAIDCLRDVFTGPMVSRISARQAALEILKQTFLEANTRIHAAGAPEGSLRGMGTTLVAALIGTAGVDVCNVGDSRAYLFRKEEGLRQLTKDHSWEAEYAEHFRGGAAEFAGASNLLTRALGPQCEVKVDEFSAQLRSGDILLLCSDGLTGMVEHGKIEGVLAGSSSMKAAVDELVKRANESGGADNITVIAIRSSG